MYLPITYAPAPATGMGNYRRLNPLLQDSEFYPPPYNTDSPVDLSDVYGIAAAGLGDFTDSLTADSVITGVPNWVLGAGALAALVFVGSRSGKKQAVRKARERYQSELDRIDKEFTVGGKARKAARRIPRVRVA